MEWLDSLMRDGVTYSLRSHVEGHELTIQDPDVQWETVVSVTGAEIYRVLAEGRIRWVRHRLLKEAA